jgi:hypothetical protein
MDNETFPVLYILMRNDMDSMNAGKGMAQASHASNAFIKEMIDRGMEHEKTQQFDNIDALGKTWSTETDQGFGTVLVLAVNELQMRTAVDVATALGFISGVVHDPTYPLRDGDVCHFLPIDTCAYVFGDKNDPMLGAVVGNFPLHP